jgi:predicted nucleotidyltransferase
MDKSEIIEQIREGISTLADVRVAYLYGSFLTRKDFRDIDIAVLVEPSPDPYQMLSRAAEIGCFLEERIAYSRELDVRILNGEPVWFQYQVISTGNPVYTRDDDDRIDFETRVLVEYQDVKYMYDLFDREYLVRA